MQGRCLGETNLLGFGFGPSNVAVWRMQCALEVGDHAEAAAIAESVDAEALTVRARQAVYWREYGRALARLPKRRDAAVMMLRRAEQISPEHVHLLHTRRTDSEGETRRSRSRAPRHGLPSRPARITRSSVCLSGKVFSATAKIVQDVHELVGVLLWSTVFVVFLLVRWQVIPRKTGR